jgi:enoyl-CoA hydratase/carnithine racemase
MDIAPYCDIRFASENAKFGWFFVRRGVLGTVGGTFILRQLVGLSKAFELTMTGDLVEAAEAKEIPRAQERLHPPATTVAGLPSFARQITVQTDSQGLLRACDSLPKEAREGKPDTDVPSSDARHCDW